MSDRPVLGFIKLPWWRNAGCKVAWIGMQLRIPGAAWLYFRCLLGSGVPFTTREIDL